VDPWTPWARCALCLSGRPLCAPVSHVDGKKLAERCTRSRSRSAVTGTFPTAYPAHPGGSAYPAHPGGSAYPGGSADCSRSPRLLRYIGPVITIGTSRHERRQSTLGAGREQRRPAHLPTASSRPTQWDFWALNPESAHQANVPDREGGSTLCTAQPGLRPCRDWPVPKVALKGAEEGGPHRIHGFRFRRESAGTGRGGVGRRRPGPRRSRSR
jgi:hypothetical protein